jgi:hypothetical protein
MQNTVTLFLVICDYEHQKRVYILGQSEFNRIATNKTSSHLCKQPDILLLIEKVTVLRLPSYVDTQHFSPIFSNLLFMAVEKKN